MQNIKLKFSIKSMVGVMTLSVAGQVGAMELTSLNKAGHEGGADSSLDGYEVSLFGFARVATTYDFDEDVSMGAGAGDFAQINTGGTDGANGIFGISANGSRLGLSVTTPEGVHTVVSFDFDNNDTLTPRLFNAYGEYEGLMIGQNWTNFQSFVGHIPTLDFDALPGTGGPLLRTPQIRYTSGPFSVSLEQKMGLGEVNNDIGGGPSEIVQSSPIFTAKVEDSLDGLSYASAIMVRQLEVDDGTNDDTTFGYGAFISGSFALTDMLVAKGALNYTEGAAAYVYRNGNNGFFGLDAYTENASGDLEAIETTGGSIGISAHLDGGRSVNIGYGIAEQDLDDAFSDGANVGANSESNSMFIVNYKWSPVAKVDMGIEFARLERENQNGSDGEANRAMFLAQYNF